MRQRGRARRGARRRAAPRIRPARRATAGTAAPLGVPPTAWPERPTRCRKRGDRARRAELADEVDVADVDAELERGGRDQRLQLAALEALLGVEPQLLAPGCRGARRPRSSPSRSARWRATRSAMRRVLTKTSVVRCCADQLGEAVVDLRPTPRPTSPPRAARGGTSSARSRCADVAGVDDRAARRCRPASTLPCRPGSARPPRSASASPTGRCASAGGRSHSASSRSSDSARCAPRLFAGHRVDLVDDHGARRSRACARPDSRAEQDVQRLRRRHQDVRRPLAHRGRARPAACRRCAPRCGSRRRAGPAPRSSARMPASGASRLLLDVVRQRLQRRDVDDLRSRPAAAVRERPRAPARRSRRGTRPASCPSRSARRSGRGAPPRIAGHAAACAAVGAAKVRANQAATAGWKSSGGQESRRIGVVRAEVRERAA